MEKGVITDWHDSWAWNFWPNTRKKAKKHFEEYLKNKEKEKKIRALPFLHSILQDNPPLLKNILWQIL